MEQQTLPIDLARAGHRPSQAVLLRELQDPWFRFCLGLLRDVELARDAVQETALRFLKQLSNFRGESKLTTWSLGIALNVTREMRRAKGRMVQESEGMAEGRMMAGDGPDGLAVIGEQREVIRRLLGELPDRQREVVMLRYFEEMSVEETAKAMGCAEGTVKASLHQALKALKVRMREEI